MPIKRVRRVGRFPICFKGLFVLKSHIHAESAILHWLYAFDSRGRWYSPFIRPGEEAGFKPSKRWLAVFIVTLPQTIIFAALCRVELLNQSLAEEGPQSGFIFTLWNTERPSRNNLLVQLPNYGVGRWVDGRIRKSETYKLQQHNQRFHGGSIHVSNLRPGLNS